MPVRVWPGIPTGPSSNGQDGSLLKSRSGFEFQWAFQLPSIAVRGSIARAIVLAGEATRELGSFCRKTTCRWRSNPSRPRGYPGRGSDDFVDAARLRIRAATVRK